MTAAAQAPLPELRIEPTGGGSIFYIKNVSTQPMTGILIELLNYPGSYYAMWRDDVDSERLAAGAEEKITVANMTVGAVPDYVKVQAALYSDGSSSGVPEKIAMLAERRRFELETAHTLIQRLEKAKAESKPKADVMADLKQWSDSLKPASKPKRYAQPDINAAAARELINTTVASLDERSVEDVLRELDVKSR